MPIIDGKNYDRAELGIDGNCGFALLGPNIQAGEVEFVEIPTCFEDQLSNQLAACQKAMKQLRSRLNMPDLSFFFGKSHPYGS